MAKHEGMTQKLISLCRHDHEVAKAPWWSHGFDIDLSSTILSAVRYIHNCYHIIDCRRHSSAKRPTTEDPNQQKTVAPPE